MIPLTKARKIIKDLSEHFGVEEPLVSIGKSNSRRTWIYFNPLEIRLSGNADVSHLIHEFAHVIVNSDGLRHTKHSQYFTIVLSWVAEYYYGDPDKYPWRWEYPTCRKFYESIRGK